MSDIVKVIIEDILNKLNKFCNETDNLDIKCIHVAIVLGRMMMLKDSDLISDKVYSDVSKIIYDIWTGEEYEKKEMG